MATRSTTDLESKAPTPAPDPTSGAVRARPTVRLSKHHGLGNDFLIAVDPTPTLASTDAIAWCDRRRGLGADGLIALSPMAEDVWAMVLWNSDGSRPEVSGNGLRCVGQALRRHLGLTEPHAFTIRTDGGMRTLEVTPDRRSDVDQVRVDMGPATDGPPPSSNWGDVGIEPHRQVGVSIGNPHIVALVDDVNAHEITTVGPVIEAEYPDGINVHVIDVIDRNTLRLRVWERGAGYTEACGSGACAAAWAARSWDLVDERVDVVMPGGSAIVELSDTVHLTGPAAFVADIEVPV